ncbi:MAG: hypothetical protein JW729_00070 [Bacteroidales bacterium]|nr:hypothetical protein [Bacteroidales bacterium]
MKKILFLILLVSTILITISCKKVLDTAEIDKLTFLVRLPSIAQARFEARCVSESVFIDRVIVQSPSSYYITEEFQHQQFAIDETFMVGNLDAEDGLWFITFIGTSALTNEDFRQIVPYEMALSADDTE